MGVVVFDADVLIAYLGREDAHHIQAVERVRKALEPGTRRLISAVNYTEVLIGPLEAAGEAGAELADAMFDHLQIEAIGVDRVVARRAAAVRTRTKLKLPDAYAVATALVAQERGDEPVRLESFDKKVIKRYDELRRPSAEAD